MKYIIVLADGMADRPTAELGGLTPMMVAKKPWMNALAARGAVGLCRTVATGEVPGSDVANMAILGYEPRKYLRGRSALEALAIGVDLSADEESLRANLVTLSEGEVFVERRLLDYSAGDIEPRVARELFALLARELDDEDGRIFAGNGFRGIWRHKYQGKCRYVAAHDMMGERVGENLPEGAGAERVIGYMERAAAILAEAPYNCERRKQRKKPANGLWLWGAGRPSGLPSFAERQGLQGAVVAGASLIKGIALAAGLRLLDLPSATGGVVTDFVGKGRVAAEYLLSGGEFVFVHIEAPDEAGHQGDVAAKVAAIEGIDRGTLATLTERLAAAGEDFRLVVMPDHATPLELRTHSAEPVPFLLFDSREQDVRRAAAFDEECAARGELGEIAAAELLPLLLEKDCRIGN